MSAGHDVEPSLPLSCRKSPLTVLPEHDVDCRKILALFINHRLSDFSCENFHTDKGTKASWRKSLSTISRSVWLVCFDVTAGESGIVHNVPLPTGLVKSTPKLFDSLVNCPSEPNQGQCKTLDDIAWRECSSSLVSWWLNVVKDLFRGTHNICYS